MESEPDGVLQDSAMSIDRCSTECIPGLEKVSCGSGSEQSTSGSAAGGDINSDGAGKVAVRVEHAMATDQEPDNKKEDAIDVVDDSSGSANMESVKADTVNPDAAPTPSRVVTRRSQRKLNKDAPATLAKPAQRSEEPMEMDELDSMLSEQDSVESDSTLTIKSSRQRDQKSRAQSKKSNSKAKSKVAAIPGSAVLTKGKSRRAIFKKSATKAPSAVARAVVTDRVYYKGQFFSVGDIVALTDITGDIFYAQLRGFLTDQYCEKSGVITWLLPTTNSPAPEEGFDPATYVIGPEEELPRKLDYMTFVMHAPDDYFYYRKAPYPTIAIDTNQEYILTRLGPKVRFVRENGKPFYKSA